MTAQCPSWCAQHYDDFDSFAEPDQAHTRMHHGAETTTNYRVCGGPQTVAVTVRLERFDMGATIGTVVVGLRGTEYLRGRRVDDEYSALHLDNPMPLASVAALIQLLQGAIAADGATAASETAVGAITRRDQHTEMVECRDCPTAFYPDSSPHPDRCWLCAERVDGLVTS